MKIRFTKLTFWLPAAYLLWSLLVFVGSFGGNAHSWWPMFLYPLIWPLSAFDKYCADHFYWLASDAQSVPAWVYTADDWISGGFYILVGTAWYWLIAKLLTSLTRRVVGETA